MLITLLCCGRYLLQRRYAYWNQISNLKLFIDIIFGRPRTIPPCGQIMDNTKSISDDSEKQVQVFMPATTSEDTLAGGDDRLQHMFDAAVKVIQRLPKDGPYQPSNSTKLRFYSLYKQATDGKCTQAQPFIFQIIDRAKWDAWSRLGDMTKGDAMKEYVDELKKIVETMSYSGEVQDFLETVNPFYEFVQHGQEISNLKESLDQNQLISSSDTDTSSSNTSVHTSPVHIPQMMQKSTVAVTNGEQESALTATNGEQTLQKSATVVENGWAKHNGHGDLLHMNGNHTHRGGICTDKESLEEQLINDDDDPPCRRHSFASSFHPPSAPIHRRSITGCTSSDFDDGFRPLSEDAKHDVLKVDRDDSEKAGTLTARLSADNLTSPAESDRYYSAESDEPDMESGSKVAPPLEPLFSLPGNSCSTVRFRQGQNSTVEVNRILQNTVDRLNRDVDHILARIRLLEAAYATHEQRSQANSLMTRRRSIFGVTRPALALILTWPFVAFFIIKLVSLWLTKRRRRN